MWMISRSGESATARAVSMTRRTSSLSIPRPQRQSAPSRIRARLQSARRPSWSRRRDLQCVFLYAPYDVFAGIVIRHPDDDLILESKIHTHRLRILLLDLRLELEVFHP